MKICSPQLGLSPISSLGGEIYDYQTLKGFAEAGFKVFVYLPKNKNYDKKIKNLQVSFAPFSHIYPPILYSFITLPYVFSLFKKEKFDILRIHSPRFLGLMGIIFNIFYPKVPILISAVTVDKSNFYLPLEKLIFKKASGIIVQSEYMKRFIIKKYKVRKEKIKVTYGGLLTKRKNKRIESPLNLTDNKIILFMGALIERKNPLFLVEVFKSVVKKYPKVIMVFIGEGQLKEDIKKRLKKYGLLDKTVFVSKAYDELKDYWFNKMDVFVCPSLNEGFGLVVTEAMSYSKPVITSDKAAFGEIVTNGIDGHTLQLKTSLWSNCLVNLLKNGNLAKKLGQNGYKSVNNKFNWERTYKLNKEFVESLVR